MYADKRRRAAHLNPLEDLPEGVNDGEEADEWQAHHGEHNNGSG
jgi:hypothetical protein